MKKIFTVRVLLTSALFVLPLVAAAQASQLTTGFTTIGGLVDTFTGSVVRSLATLALTVAVVAFFYGIVQYIWGLQKGDGPKTKVGRDFMLWGLIALFVMFSIWGIITYAQRIFGIEGQTTIRIPRVDFNTSGNTNSSSPNSSTGALPSGSNTGSQTGNNGTTANPAVSTSNCTGRPQGSACIVSGRAGTCDYSDEGVYGCYAIPSSTSNSQTGDAVCRSYGAGAGCTTSGGAAGHCDANLICQAD